MEDPMSWIEDMIVDPEDRRVLLATAGPYLLSVIEHADGSAHWSCGVGDDEVADEHEGTAPDAEGAMRSAIEDARRRWLETDGMLGTLEVDMRRMAAPHAAGADYDLASQ